MEWNPERKDAMKVKIIPSKTTPLIRLQEETPVGNAVYLTQAEILQLQRDLMIVSFDLRSSVQSEAANVNATQ